MPQSRFDKYAEELEQDYQDGFLTKEEFRRAMRELVEDFRCEEEDDY